MIAAVSITVAVSSLAENPDAITDKMTDEELRIYRDRKISELKQRALQVHPEQATDGTHYSCVFFCTVYYTPKESGFTRAKGFDSMSVSAPGLHGRKFSRDFLAAVKKEGFGRIDEPFDGHNYIRWIGDGRFSFARAPLGRHGELLVPRRSCAVSSRNKLLRRQSKLTIRSETVQQEIGSEQWLVCDTGPGLHPLQIDLYWGEDEPRGAVGRQRARPSGTWMEYAFEVEVIARR
ncbi:MAG TPA: hypothetical protein VGH08_05705 [Chthoniobacterales bacterium]